MPKPPKSTKPTGKPWVCGCKVQQLARVLFCKRCGKGQS